LFPEPQSPDPSGHFEGILFGSPAGEVSISEASCTEYIDLALVKCIELEPQGRGGKEMLIESNEHSLWLLATLFIVAIANASTSRASVTVTDATITNQF
jgi:hypothetical protein